MNEINEFAALVKNSSNIVFFGGAGVSTESGIPDFRSEKGLYSAEQNYGHPPEYLLSRTCFKRRPDLFFRYYRENLVARSAQPNAAHLALAKLEGQGKLRAVITQNIDGLHQAAGSKNVLELHGSNWRQYCMACKARYGLDDVLAQEGIPSCEKCNGTVRPDVVLYEERLDDNVVNAAINAIAKADLLIVGGTSLAVYPAAGLLQYFRGESIVLVNKSATHLDEQARLVIRDSIGSVLGAVMKLL